MSRFTWLGSLGLLGLLLLSAFPPTAAANPVVPYCLGSVAPIPRTVPPQIMPEVCESATGRVFPEAMAHPDYVPASHGFATDFVAFPEAEAGLKYLETKFPDWMTLIKVADSYGLNAAGGGRDRFPIYVVEVTNEKSPMPAEKKQDLLFMLSIHGNEKGGREGGLRVIEDLVKNIGIATQRVHNGAGMPSALVGPSGKNVETYRDYLDFMRLYFLFPNVDGWMHDELPYVSQPLCPFSAVPTTLFCRGNGNGTDLNRQTPTVGWQMQNAGNGRIAVNEPEAKGYLNWMTSGNHTWRYAIDIHGQLNHANFVPVMMPAGSFTPQEMARSTRLAELLKERLNNEPHFKPWTTACGAAETAELPPVDGPGPLDLEGAPSREACSAQFAEWSTVWDAIGYTDSGFSGDFFAQSTGLNAPGYDIEMSYNHITVDSQYEAGALFNDYHVNIVRHVTKTFMDSAALDVQVSYETHGRKTLYLESLYVATNLDDAKKTPGGWADQNTADDPWQYSEANPIRARPAKYWSDIQPFLKDGDKPGILVPGQAAMLTKEYLAQFDTLVIPGSAINQFIQGTAGSNQVAKGTVDTAKVQVIVDWVKNGGNLVLTDAGLKFFDLAGLTRDKVASFLGYAGAINLVRTHELNKDVRGAARQTYEPVALGFQVGINSPIWAVNATAATAAGIDSAGTGYRNGDVSLGRLPLGKGKIQFIGAFLPDPTEEFYHPYGLDDYATTYSGNQILRNMLGWDQVFAAPPVVFAGTNEIKQSHNEPIAASGTDAGKGKSIKSENRGTPGPDILLLMAAIAGAVVIAARRRGPGSR